MHRDAPHSSARVLAPLALVLCTIAFFVVILSSGSSDQKSNGSTTPTSTSKRPGTTTAKQPGNSSYTVKAGDTLGGIAAKTGVSVAKIQELNPGLDPQALVSGQKIKLRE